MTKSRAKVGERLPYLLGKLKTPRVLQRLEHTAERARAEQWPYEQGVWLPPPVMRPEPADVAPAWVAQVTVTPPELSDYAELCA